MKYLKVQDCFNKSHSVGEKNLATHLLLAWGLSKPESISIDDGVGVRGLWRREDNFPLKDPAILRMRLVSGCLSLDMMIVRRESRRLYDSEFALPTVNSSLPIYWILQWRLNSRLPADPIRCCATSKNGLFIVIRGHRQRCCICAHGNITLGMIRTQWPLFSPCSKRPIRERRRVQRITLRPGASLLLLSSYCHCLGKAHLIYLRAQILSGWRIQHPNRTWSRVRSAWNR